MIVDLVRNDLGRVCVPGTVEVLGLMGLRSYCGVWHGVSNVRGTLDLNRSPGDLLEAVFPGGSITGAPKRRAIEIIRTLEGEGRGFYTGSLGIIRPDGGMSLSILIRTLVRDVEGWNLNVGGGIVADSDVKREVRETWEKIEVFRRALQRNRYQATTAWASNSWNRRAVQGIASRFNDLVGTWIRQDRAHQTSI